MKSDVHLFAPADAFQFPQPTDDGTPTQKDEASAENPPTGAIFDSNRFASQSLSDNSDRVFHSERNSASLSSGYFVSAAIWRGTGASHRSSRMATRAPIARAHLRA